MSTASVTVTRDRRALTGWLTAQVISATGTRLSLIAIPWFVLTTTGSATRTGLVAFFEMTPYVLLKALGGPLIDRFGARRVSVGGDLGSVVSVGAIPLLHSIGALPLWSLLAAVTFTGAFRGPGDGAKQALVPRVAQAAGAPLERVTGFANAVDRTAGMAGGAAGGFLIAAFGAPFALWLDAASFVLAAALIAVTAPGKVIRDVQDGSVSESYVSQLRAGWAFLRGDQVLIAMTVMVGLTNLLDQAYFTVLLPTWALHSGGGSAAVGVILAVSSAGAVVGSMIAAGIGARLPRYLVYFVAFLFAGAPRFLSLGLGFPFAAVLVVAGIGGFASGFLNPILGAVIVERIPPELFGRVSSLNAALCWGLMPFGGLVAGAAIAGLTLSPALIACGVAYFGFTMFPVLLPRWKEIDQRPA